MSLEENKAVARRLFEEITADNLDLVNVFYADTYVHHYPSNRTASTSIDEWRTVWTAWAEAFPDFQQTVEDVLAEADKVVVRFSFRGTHQGPFLGIQPSGKQVAVTGVLVLRLAGGKAIEGWEEYDALGMMQQLGVIPSLE